MSRQEILFLALGWLCSWYFDVVRLQMIFFASMLMLVGYSAYMPSYMLPVLNLQRSVNLIGKINTIPSISGNLQRFLLLPDKHSKLIHGCQILVSTPVKINWQAGGWYKLTLKLKPVHALKNPYQNNYDRLYSYCWQGKIINSVPQLLKAPSVFSMLFIRQHLLKRLQAEHMYFPQQQWLAALLVGVHNNINPQDWQVLRLSGTNHLLVVGGLHLSILITGLELIIKWLSRFNKKPSPNIILDVITLSVVMVYASLTDWGVPAQRAFLMLLAHRISKNLNYPITATGRLFFAASVILILQPKMSLTPGFWFSVITIIIILSIKHKQNKPLQHLMLPKIITLGLIPLEIIFYQEFNLLGIVANILAIPIMAVVILPAIVLAILTSFTPLFSLFIWLASLGMYSLWKILFFLQTFTFLHYNYVLDSKWQLLIISIMLMLYLLPRGFPHKGYAGFLAMSLYFKPAHFPNEDEIWLTIFDVGQGLACVVQTAHHTLIFDAGPQRGGFNAGQQIILPFLQHQQIKNLDALVVSHADNDHIGGAAAILQNIHTANIYTSAPEKFSQAIACQQGMTWHWDGINFQFLYPITHNAKKNNNSCVLKVTNTQFSILLPGDIELAAETELLQQKTALTANIIVSPHHGSRTSNSAAFIAAVRPQWVVFSTGFLNHYHLPHPLVVARYTEQQVRQLNTAYQGAMQFKLSHQINLLFADQI